MRSVSILSALLISVSTSALAAAPKAATPLNMNDWHVAPVMNANDTSANYCAMAARYDGGPIVTFTRNATNRGTVAVDFKNADLTTGKKYSVTTRINKKTRTFQAPAISKTQLVLNLGDDTTIYDDLSLGNPLLISLDGTAGVYHLNGNIRAFFEFDHCLKALAPTTPTDETIDTVKNEPVKTDAIAPIAADKPATIKAPVIADAPKIEQKIEKEKITAPIVADKPSEPMKLATPAFTPVEKVAEKAPEKIAEPVVATKPAAPNILWDSTPFIPVKKIEPKTEIIAAAPIAPVMPAPIVEKQKLAEIKSEEIPAIIKGPVSETPDLKIIDEKPAVKIEEEKVAEKSTEKNHETSRLKSTLAQARAEAATAPIAAPVIAAPIIQAPVATPPKPVATLATTQTTPTPPSEIQGLIFDNADVKKSAREIPSTPAKLEKMTPDTPPVVVIKPLPPSRAPVVPEPVAPKAYNDTLDGMPILQDEMPALPPAMPKPMLSVSAEQPAAALNTVTPSVGHPAAIPVVTPAAAMPRARKIVNFRPAPVAPAATWRVDTIEAQSNKPEDSFCLVENKYTNDSILMIGQRADGYSTLGVNYGIDMLQLDRDYHVTVQVDGEFEEDFTAYAENPRTLVVQLGKKASFFDTLTGANGLRVAMPGTASSFDISDLPSSLNAFSDCVVKLGGSAITPPAFMAPIVAAVPIEPVTESALIASTFPKPVPVPPMAAPVIAAPVIAAPPVAPAPIAAPAKQEVIFDLPPQASAPPPAPIAVTPAVEKATWAQSAEAFLFATGIAAVSPQKDAKNISWSQSGIKATAASMSEGDILDAATAALDISERACDGTFSSQIGLPETIGDTEIQLMESKCDARNNVHVTTWLMEKKDGVVTAWSFDADRALRAEAFALRETIRTAKANDTEVSQKSSEDARS